MQIMGTKESVRGSTTPTVLICMGHLCFGHLYGGRKKRHGTSFIYCGFAREVTAAMLMVKNKSISLHLELYFRVNSLKDVYWIGYQYDIAQLFNNSKHSYQ